jgi:hypothetical protein
LINSLAEETISVFFPAYCRPFFKHQAKLRRVAEAAEKYLE